MRDAQEGGGGATRRERERAMAIQQKALKENPSPDNPNLCFFWFDSHRDSGAETEEERTGNIVRGGKATGKKSTFHFHGFELILWG